MAFIYGPDGDPLKNRAGAQLYQLTSPLMYASDVAGLVITVPTGFISDLASIPRIPFFYLLLNQIADEPGVIHDFIYSTALLPRAMADNVLREACLLIGISSWKVNLIYFGVRVGGASHYGPQYTA